MRYIGIVLLLFAGALSAEEVLYSGELGAKARSPLEGSWEIVREDDGRDILRLKNNFRSRGGPDLKIFFSTLPLEEVTSHNAGQRRYSVRIAKLKKFKGAQEYRLPLRFDLTKYKSWVIHCEAHAHLWDGAALVASE